MTKDIIYAMAGFGAGLYFFYQGFKIFKKSNLISSTPTSKVRSIAMGPTEVYGKVSESEDGKILSPFTKRECIYCKYTIEEYINTGKGGYWKKVKENESDSRFYLEDETGKVLVDPRKAEIKIKPDYEISSGVGSDPPETVKEYLEKNGIAYEGFLGINKKMRYKEYYIQPGEKVYIFGSAAHFNTNGYSPINAENIIIKKGDFSPFYISDKSEEKIMKDLGNKYKFYIIGGPILSIGCLAYILWRINILT